jgi:C-22 sterol desaturase
MATNLSNLAIPQMWQTKDSEAYQQPVWLHCFVSYLHLDWLSWQFVATLLLMLIAYDQGMAALLKLDHVFRTTNIATVIYIKRKGSIAGPAFKIPFMGPFLQALHPNFESYLAQWASGPLSCVSVFHK